MSLRCRRETAKDIHTASFEDRVQFAVAVVATFKSFAISDHLTVLLDAVKQRVLQGQSDRYYLVRLLKELDAKDLCKAAKEELLPLAKDYLMTRPDWIEEYDNLCTLDRHFADDQYPIRSQRNRFASKEVQAPQTILNVADER